MDAEAQLRQAYHDHKWFLTIYPRPLKRTQGETPYLNLRGGGGERAFVPLRDLHKWLCLFREAHGMESLANVPHYETLMLDREYELPTFPPKTSLKGFLFSEEKGIGWVFTSGLSDSYLGDGKRATKHYTDGPDPQEVMSRLNSPDLRKLVLRSEFF